MEKCDVEQSLKYFPMTLFSVSMLRMDLLADLGLTLFVI